VSPPPILEVGCLAEMFEGGAAKSRGLAARLRAVAHAQAVPFVDAGELVEVSAIDGIHYDPAANPVLAEAFAQAIGRHFAD
jgi:lysophospholipase L1-like esterase